MSGKINAFILTTVDRRADISLIKNLKAWRRKTLNNQVAIKTKGLTTMKLIDSLKISTMNVF
jgi:hypothetical protein